MLWLAFFNLKILNKSLSAALAAVLMLLGWQCAAAQPLLLSSSTAQRDSFANNQSALRQKLDSPLDNRASDFSNKSLNAPQAVAYTANSAGGVVDETFNAGVLGGQGYVNAVVVQPDGKILIGGLFNEINGVACNFIARLNSDQSIDETFNPGAGANNTIRAIAVQPDGKILIGGSFTEFNGNAVNRIGRLNSDGSFDASFNAGTGANSTVETIAVQPNGKVLVGGSFSSFNDATHNRIARLNSNGSLDTGFSIGTGANGTVYAIAVQTDGRILVGGTFITFNGIVSRHLVRLDFGGGNDSTLTSGFDSGTASQVRALQIQPDGKILVGGFFTAYSDVTSNGLVRVSNNGSLETAFPTLPATVSERAIVSIVLQPDEKIVVGGAYYDEIFNELGGIERFNADGGLDSTFTPPASLNAPIVSVAVQLDGKIVCAGFFTSVASVERSYLIRLNSDGSQDNAATAAIEANGVVYSIAPQTNGKILIGGDFKFVNGVRKNRIARLNSDGSLDSSFNSGTGTDGTVRAIVVQPDGRILVGGLFGSYNGTTSFYGLVRLNSDGSLDSSFRFAASSFLGVYAIAIQPDGKILVAGGFQRPNVGGSVGVVRLNQDGSLDSSFNYSFQSQNVRALTLQSDGKICFGGAFSGSMRTFLGRFNSNGSLDNTFPGANSTVETIVAQTDGKIMVGGSFTGIGGTSVIRIARLNSDGSVDSSFNPGAGADNTVFGIAQQPDGKTLIGGRFTRYNNQPINRLARLNSDGSLDTSFNIGTGANAYVDEIALQADGKIIVGGNFSAFNNQPHKGLVRLQSAATAIRAPYDFDGDGKTDFAVFRPSNAVWYLQNTQTGFAAAEWGIATDKLVPADYDGDGKTDIAVYRGGTWYLLRSTAGVAVIEYGLAGDIPVPADYTGDGKAELAVYRQGVWYILNLVNNQTSAAQFGLAGDLPVPADYDGDGKTDLALYRGGVWYLLQSLDGFKAFEFGLADDKPAVGDYDGDARADAAVYRNGEWYLLRSQAGFAGVQFGVGSDKPTVGDYDGDGKSDIAVWRPENGAFYILRSSGNQPLIYQFGLNGDAPVAASFVP